MASLFVSPDAPQQLLVQLRSDATGMYELDVNVTDGNGHVFDHCTAHTGGDLSEGLPTDVVELLARYWFGGRLADVKRLCRRLMSHR